MPPLSFLILVICFFFFPLINLVSSLSFLLMFSYYKLWFHWFFSYYLSISHFTDHYLISLLIHSTIMKSILPDINIAISAFLWLVLSWYFFYPVTFNYLYFYWKLVYYRQYIVVLIFHSFQQNMFFNWRF